MPRTNSHNSHHHNTMLPWSQSEPGHMVSAPSLVISPCENDLDKVIIKLTRPENSETTKNSPVTWETWLQQLSFNKLDTLSVPVYRVDLCYFSEIVCNNNIDFYFVKFLHWRCLFVILIEVNTNQFTTWSFPNFVLKWNFNLPIQHAKFWKPLFFPFSNKTFSIKD